MTATTNIYTERNRLVAYLAAQWPSVMCYDEECDGYYIIFIDLPTGQVSWHIPEHDLQFFNHGLSNQTKSNDVWDGHNTEEKYDRLKLLVDITE